MGIKFTEYKEAYFRELSAMIFALYAEDSYGEKMSLGKIRRTIEKLASAPERGRILLFISAGVVAGYAIVIYYWSNELGGDIVIIDELYVKPDQRRQGLGRRFIEYLLNYKKVNVKALQLEVTPENRGAWEFYLRLGFVPLTNRGLMLKTAKSRQGPAGWK